ncbi:MAG: hypothetical protein R3343_03745 [Nitriliruptorales bacterium]|nr:hypothetical protein [Nitriliruptorales bacterium]
MYRYRQIAQVKYGHMSDYFASLRKLLELAAERGYQRPSVLMPVVGTVNELVIEFKYDTYEAWERDRVRTAQDEQFRDAMVELATHVVQGSARDELFTTPPQLTDG